MTALWAEPSYLVFTRPDFDVANPWIERGAMEGMRVTQSLGSQLGQAQWTHRIGTISEQGEMPGTTTNINFPSLIGQWVRIQWNARTSGADVPHAWYGIITDVAAQDLGGTDANPAANYSVTAYSPEWVLSRYQIDDSYVFDGALNPGKRITRAIQFNGGRDGEFGRQVDSVNMSDENTNDDARAFWDGKSNPEAWTATEILRYLFTYHQPHPGQRPLWLVDFSGTAADVLNWYKPTIQTQNRTLYDVINACIPRTRGVVWWTTFNETVSPPQIIINLETTVSAPILLPGGTTLPANLNQITIDPFDDDDEANAIASAGTILSEQQAYQSVKTIGDRRLEVASFKVDPLQLNENWISTEETSYKSAGSTDPEYSNTNLKVSERKQICDQARREFDFVYSSFALDMDWDGVTTDSLGSNFVRYAAQQYWTPGLRFESVLPLKEGIDYTDPQSPTPISSKPSTGLQSPFAVVKLANLDRWERVDELRSSEHLEKISKRTDPKFACRLVMMRDVPGVVIKPMGAANHVIALNHFTPVDHGSAQGPGDETVSETRPILDFATLEFTLAFKLDEHVTGTYPPFPAVRYDRQNFLLINLAERAQKIQVTEGTITKIEDGQLQRVQFTTPIRDDTSLCEDVSRIAWEYYKEPRASLDYQLNTIWGVYQIGQLVTQYRSTGINSIVSSITWDWRANRTQIVTRYADLDFAGLV